MRPGRIGILLLVVAGILAAALLARRDDGATAVTISRVSRVASIRSVVTASGEVVAARYADIGANMMGRLIALPVKEGDRVAAGQLLARIDPVQAAAAADAAQAALAALEAEASAAGQQQHAAAAALDEARARAAESASALTRARQLRDAGLMPAADFDKADAAAKAAEAQVLSATAAVERSAAALEAARRRAAKGRAEGARARDQLNKTDITAPINGAITRLDVELGEMVVIGVQNQPGTILMTVSDLSAINAEVKVAEADVMRLAVGQPSVITFEALPGTSLAGRVVEIGASALPLIGQQAAAREFKVKVQLDPTGVPLRPGLTCDAEITTSEKRDALTVPLQAVVERGGTRGVFTVQGGTARFTPVSTGIIGGLSIEVTGLPEGTEIVSGSIQALRGLADGAAIKRMATP
jgi:HlyD family secretion protein